jgi:hypothetical protein
MKVLKILISALALLPAAASAADSDFLAQEKIAISSPKSEDLVKEAVADVAGIFENFQPALDDGSTLVSPVKVTGPKASPTVQLTVRKCVMGLVCQNVDLVGEVTVKPTHGSCTHNFGLHIDMSRSSDILAATYDALNADLCYQKDGSGNGSLTFSASAHHGPRYGLDATTELTQEQILDFLKMQVAPITRAIQTTIQQLLSH